MGFDTVELVMAVEEEFGIEIPDSAAEAMETPAAVIDFIERALAGVRYPLCPTQRAFHQIRRTFIEMGRTRSAIRVQTALSHLFPRRGRRAAWRRMRESFKPLTWPELKRPRWLTQALFVATIALSGVILWALESGPIQSTSDELVVLPTLGFACTAVLLFWVTKPLATQFPALETIGDLTRRIGVVGRIRPMHPNENLSRAQIAEAVRQITLEQLGISPEEYGEDKYFVRDFGAG